MVTRLGQINGVAMALLDPNLAELERILVWAYENYDEEFFVSPNGYTTECTVNRYSGLHNFVPLFERFDERTSRTSRCEIG